MSSSAAKVHFLEVGGGGAAGDGKQAGLRAHPDEEGPHRLIAQGCVGRSPVQCKASHAGGPRLIPLPLTLHNSHKYLL